MTSNVGAPLQSLSDQTIGRGNDRVTSRRRHGHVRAFIYADQCLENQSEKTQETYQKFCYQVEQEQRHLLNVFRRALAIQNVAIRSKEEQVLLSIKNLGNQYEDLEIKLRKLRVENDNLKGQIALLENKLCVSEESCTKADFIILELQTRLEKACLNEEFALDQRNDAFKQKDISGIDLHKRQAALNEKQNELDQVNDEIQVRQIQLQNAMREVESDHPLGRQWEKFFVFILMILGIPTVFGTIEAFKWMENIDKPLNEAFQAIIREFTAINRLNKRRDLLTHDCALMRGGSLQTSLF